MIDTAVMYIPVLSHFTSLKESRGIELVAQVVPPSLLIIISLASITDIAMYLPSLDIVEATIYPFPFGKERETLQVAP